MKTVHGLIAGLVVVLLYAWSTGIFSPDWSEGPTPCSEPLTYKIGRVDDRFFITENELLEISQEVSEVWSEAAGTPVIEYRENGDITVNLIYAEEQKLTDREQQFRDRLEEEELRISELEEEYGRMNRRYEEEVRQYEQDSRELQQSIERLNEWVAQKNREGGFNQENLEDFEERKSEIDQAKQELNRREQMLKQEAEELNERVSFLNERIEHKNRMVDEYNRTFSGEREFTQGAYEWNTESRTINIYQFIDREELKLVIAHEMGHALGIAHVSNPESVMYRLMGNQARPGIILTEEDVMALRNNCKNPLN